MHVQAALLLSTHPSTHPPCRVTPRELNATVLASLQIPVQWIVSTAPDFSVVVGGGTVNASAGQDFTVKTEVTGLTPGKDYYYIFVAAKVIK